MKFLEVSRTFNAMAEVVRRLSQDPDRLFKRRILANLTQQQLGDKVNRAKSTISKLELGNCSARPDTLHALAEALGCTVDQLMPANMGASQ